MKTTRRRKPAKLLGPVKGFRACRPSGSGLAAFGLEDLKVLRLAVSVRDTD